MKLEQWQSYRLSDIRDRAQAGVYERGMLSKVQSAHPIMVEDITFLLELVNKLGNTAQESRGQNATSTNDSYRP